jgi:hypothetical protein
VQPLVTDSGFWHPGRPAAVDRGCVAEQPVRDGRYAFEIRHRAERRLGEIMAQQAPGIGRAGPGRPSSAIENGSGGGPISRLPSLAEAGISKRLADQARKSAALSSDEFETLMVECRNRIADEADRLNRRIINAGARAVVRQLPVEVPTGDGCHAVVWLPAVQR